MSLVRCRIKPYIQPFEKDLALRELAAITGQIPAPIDATGGAGVDYIVESSVTPERLATRLAFWEGVMSDSMHVTTQSRYESTTVVHSQPDQVPMFNPPMVRRRTLRYGVHGIHEYRGKFYPQLVRALLNMSDSDADEPTLLDPMVGSGTALVEALVAGYNAFGADLNPLSVFIAQTKCDLLCLSPREVSHSTSRLIEAIDRERVPPQAARDGYSASLADRDQEYLARWFDQATIAELDAIAAAISAEPSQTLRSFFKVVLSNILRTVSWQDDRDLRVRRRKTAPAAAAIDTYLRAIERSSTAVMRFLEAHNRSTARRAVVVLDDARHLATLNRPSDIDVLITSPPYATALPYLDTDRLSLVYLGLLPRAEYADRNFRMIGNREITDSVRVRYLEDYERSRSLLTADICALVDEVASRNAGTSVGFRRRNTAALLSKYFVDMRQVLTASRETLKSGASAFFVVGSNHTVAGGKRIDIPTAFLLAGLAETLGWKIRDSIGMDMLASRDLFRHHAGPTETIVWLSREG